MDQQTSNMLQDTNGGFLCFYVLMIPSIRNTSEQIAGARKF